MTTQQCNDCGRTVDKLPHSPVVASLNEENIGYYLTAKCAGCSSEVWLSSMRDQGLENWFVQTTTRKLYCTFCSHELGLDQTTL